MKKRLMFLPTLFVFIIMACSLFPVGLPDNTATSVPTIPLDTSAFPEPTPTLEIFEPTNTIPVPTASIPPITASPVQTPETDLPNQLANWEPSYKLQPGSPIATENIFHPEQGCNWMGVGGQVFGESGQPVGMLVVELGGLLDDKNLEAMTLTGSASQWGPAGFEFNLAEEPVSSSRSLWIQLLDLEGSPLSEKTYFDTFDDCDKAAIMINFAHSAALVYEQLYFPVIIHNP